MTPINIKTIVAGILLAGALPQITHAQSSDALLKKLVDKGILTTKEAEDLQKGSKDEAKKTWVAGAGMPDWVKSMRLYGDFRARNDQNTAANDAYFDRNRFRYRLRIGATATFTDNFELGFRVASGNPLTANGVLLGGSPITANQDLNALESRKFLWIDAAYAKWTPIKNDKFTLSTTIGKMDNPFQLSNMIWDYDIVPEGAGLQLAYNFNDKHTLKGNTAFFVLDELNQGNPSGSPLPAGVNVNTTHDPYVYGAQALIESKWTPAIDTSLGVAVFRIDNRDALSNKVQPSYNSGNSRDGNGFLKYAYNPIVGSASGTYKFASGPLYPGEFPIKLSGEFMDNPPAPSNEQGWRLGLTLGKAGKKGAWEVAYRYQRLEADAWFDALVDDDNGAYYAAGNSQAAKGWFGGTNVRGHQVIATYSITDFLNFSFIYYDNDLIIKTPGQNGHAQHFMADLNWKF
jgi:hypothetical protein